MYKFLLSIFFIFISFNLEAQTWELGGTLGGAGYMGDLNPNNPVKISGPSIGAFAKRNFNGYLSAKLNYNWGQISADDSKSSNEQFRERNLNFKTTLSEVSISGEFNFLSYIPEAGKNKFTPYLYLGAGAVNYYPYTTYNGKSYSLRGARTEGETKQYPNTAIAYMYGIGVKYNIMGKFTLGADMGYRNPNTDYLDDVSGLYADRGAKNSYPGALADRSGEKTGLYIGVPGTQRGDLRPHDTYFFAQVTLSYTFVTEKCYFQK